MDSEATAKQICENYPYESNALKQTHPLHLYHLGKLLGLDPKPYQKANVLELACASGGNLIPMAFHEKGSTFLGIDISASQIAQGQAAIGTLNLKNIILKAASILDFNCTEKFDYIICHGLFSWVQETVRNKVLQICRENLNKQGIAYISYNTYPSWAVGNTLRDMLLYQCANLTSSEKIAHVRSLLETLSRSLNQDSPYFCLLREEVKLVLSHSDNQLLHEHLSDEHYPLHFLQFIEHISAFQLAYLGDATFAEPHQDIYQLQCQDYLQNRRFRSSLICLQGAAKAVTRDGKFIKAVYDNLQSHLIPEQDTMLSQKPRASALVQYQATKQLHVTNSYHENILLTPVAHALMPYLDGEHDFLSLTFLMKQWFEVGLFELFDDQQRPIRDKNEVEKRIDALCHKTLKLLAQRSLIR